MNFNLLSSPEDKRDWKAAGIFPKAYVWDIDFRPYLRPVRDQGMLGSCVAFATATQREVQEAFDSKLKDYISPWLTYINRVNQDSDGMYPRNAYEIQRTIGCLPESMCPYMSNFTWDAEKRKMAELLKIESYYRAYTRQDVIDAMNAKTTVTLSIPVYGSDGQIWKPENGAFRGLHLVCAAASSDHGILIRNSWNEKWDEDGYVEMSWEDFEELATKREAWISVDKKTANKFTFKEKFRLFTYKAKRFFKNKTHIWVPIAMVLVAVVIGIYANSQN
jgi:hypothetical protein